MYFLVRGTYIVPLTSMPWTLWYDDPIEIWTPDFEKYWYTQVNEKEHWIQKHGLKMDYPFEITVWSDQTWNQNPGIFLCTIDFSWFSFLGNSEVNPLNFIHMWRKSDAWHFVLAHFPWNRKQRSSGQCFIGHVRVDILDYYNIV